MKVLNFLAVALISMIVPTLAFAHGGGLNADGCHTNRKTGDYHCHGAPRTPAVPAETPSSKSTTYYKNCDAARAAGAAPVRRGDPGYGSHLDRDGDGIGCE